MAELNCAKKYIEIVALYVEKDHHSKIVKIVR